MCQVQNQREENDGMKVDLNRQELHLIKLWWLSCEDMMIPEGSCDKCDLRQECTIVRKKLYGKNGGVRGKQLNNNMLQPTPAETPQQVCQPAA